MPASPIGAPGGASDVEACAIGSIGRSRKRLMSAAIRSRGADVAAVGGPEVDARRLASSACDAIGAHLRHRRAAGEPHHAVDEHALLGAPDLLLVRRWPPARRTSPSRSASITSSRPGSDGSTACCADHARGAIELQQ